MKNQPCACAQCASLCERCPGWFTPEEAEKAIAAGQALKLMRDWLEPCDEVGNAERIFALSPATVGRGGLDAPEFSFFELLFPPSGGLRKGVCIFFQNSLCAIHESGYKPRQCREAYGCKESEPPTNYDMARLWDTPKGRDVVADWQAKVK